MAWAKYSLFSTLESRGSQSWHSSAVRFQALSTGICLVMFACFTISATHRGVVGTTELFSGRCGHAVNINKVLQAVLALLSIGISVSFDFFMRLASSPTVDDLREAHSQGRSLDIAVHSLRNVRQISHWRTFGWITLISLAVPVQLFSHSIAFIAFSTTGYSRFVVSEAFTTGQPLAYPGVALWNNSWAKEARPQFDEILPKFKSASSKWDKLGVSDCKRIYSQDIEGLQSHRNLLVVIETRPDADANGWIAAQVWNNPKAHDDFGLENSLWSFATYCEVDREGYVNNGGYTKCSLSYYDSSCPELCAQQAWGEGVVRDNSSISWLIGPLDDDIRDAFRVPRVKYCLSEPYFAPCKVYVSNFFLLVTMLCVLLGCICSALVARFCWHKETCQSLGDVLHVFLNHGKRFAQNPSDLREHGNQEAIEPPSIRWTPVSKWKLSRHRWGQAISKRMWLWTYSPIGMLLLSGSSALGALGESISQVPNSPFNLSKLESDLFEDTIILLERASTIESSSSRA